MTGAAASPHAQPLCLSLPISMDKTIPASPAAVLRGGLLTGYGSNECLIPSKVKEGDFSSSPGIDMRLVLVHRPP